jgi:hypothetical protein
VEGSEVRVLLGAPRGLICCRGLPRGVVARGVVAGVGECEGGGNMEEPFFFERKRRNMLDATTLSARMSVVAWLVASIWGGVGGWERESPTQDASVSRKVYLSVRISGGYHIKASEDSRVEGQYGQDIYSISNFDDNSMKENCYA